MRFRTNLDLPGEEWPDDLPHRPMVGDIVQSKTKHGVFQLTLQVVRVTWEWSDLTGRWELRAELHMTEFQKKLPAKKVGAEPGSIVAFYEWYAPLVGRSVSSFI